MKVFIFVLFVWTVTALPHIYKEDETESSTTNTVAQTKLNFGFSTTNEDQDYVLTWTAEVYSETYGSHNVFVQFTCNGMVSNEQTVPSSNGWTIVSGWKYPNLTTGEQEFKILYGSSTFGEPVKIRRARIMATPVNAVVM